MSPLWPFVAWHPHLKRLLLSDTGVTSNGFQTLGPYIHMLRSLVSIELKHNDISEDAAMALAPHIVQHNAVGRRFSVTISAVNYYPYNDKSGFGCLQGNIIPSMSLCVSKRLPLAPGVAGSVSGFQS